MESNEITFEVDGHEATVIMPEKPNGKWLWKTEFFHAFEALEEGLFQEGYARVHYAIPDEYGSPDAVKKMHDFYLEFRKRFPKLQKKGYLIGFSRGGLYAFNYALAYPETVKGVYLDAPVLDCRVWPRTEEKYGEIALHQQVLERYHFASEQEFLDYPDYPVEKLKEYFSLKIPTLLVAGSGDSVVDFSRSGKKMVDFALEHHVPHFDYYIKLGADHHPHSFGNIEGINGINGKPLEKEFSCLSSRYPSSEDHPALLASDWRELRFFF